MLVCELAGLVLLSGLGVVEGVLGSGEGVGVGLDVVIGGGEVQGALVDIVGVLLVFGGLSLLEVGLDVV